MFIAIRRTVTMLALVLIAFGGSRVFAQEATPTTGTALPAHIHAGTCDTLGDVVYPLSDVSLAPESDDTGTPRAEPAMIHATEVLSSVTTVEVPLAELLASEHAINVHASVEDIGTYVACGDIAGQMRMHSGRGMHVGTDAAPSLVIPLRELNDSGFAGMAWLEPSDANMTTVTVFLAEGLVGPGPRP